MKKIYLFFSFLFILQVSFAQSFTSSLNRWHYNQGTMFNPIVYPVLIEPVGQQTVLGHTCTNLQITGSACSPYSNYWVYQSNDTVFYFVSTLNRFSMLYDFSAAVGDTYTVLGYNFIGNDSLQVHIDSISTILINGHPRRRFFIGQPLMGSTSLWLGTSYIEGIGSTDFLFPQFANCDPITIGLRCFEDSVLGLYETGIAPSCDSIYTLGVTNITNTSNLSVEPNPFQNRISITGLSGQNNELSIYSLVGNLVYRSRIGNQELSLDFLAKGLYVFSITDEKRTMRKRIIKD